MEKSVTSTKSTTDPTVPAAPTNGPRNETGPRPTPRSGSFTRSRGCSEVTTTAVLSVLGIQFFRAQEDLANEA